MSRRSQKRKARDGNELEAQQENTPLAHSVREIARRDGEYAGEDVGRHAHELRVVGGVTHVLDDGGQEQGEGVDGAETGHADEAVDVDLPVLDGLPDVLHVEFVGEVAVVDAQTAFDLIALFGGEELCSI